MRVIDCMSGKVTEFNVADIIADERSRTGWIMPCTETESGTLTGR